MRTEFKFKPGVLIFTKRDNGVWYKKNDTGKVIKFDHRKDGKEYWIIEIRNSQFTVCETEIDVFNQASLRDERNEAARSRLKK